MEQGRINTQLSTIHGALISGDNSGQYHTSFYHRDGKLFGATHAVDRELLSVWVAEKNNEQFTPDTSKGRINEESHLKIITDKCKASIFARFVVVIG